MKNKGTTQTRTFSLFCRSSHIHRRAFREREGGGEGSQSESEQRLWIIYAVTTFSLCVAKPWHKVCIFTQTTQSETYIYIYWYEITALNPAPTLSPVRCSREQQMVLVHRRLCVKRKFKQKGFADQLFPVFLFLFFVGRLGREGRKPKWWKCWWTLASPWATGTFLCFVI